MGRSVEGLLFVLAAGCLQGVFLLPMDRIRGWRWEHSWLAFSFFGMLLLNGLLAWLTVPNLPAVYREVPALDIGILFLFGLGWGVGAILFGRGMARLGLALGYPIIMGLIAAFGTLLPMSIFFAREFATTRGLVVVTGTAIVLLGIAICSRSSAWRVATESNESIGPGVAIAVAAGLLSSLPNVGMAFGHHVLSAATSAGASSSFAANAVWLIFFSAGFVANAAYCLALIARDGPIIERGPVPAPANLALTALMGLLWIGSFYTYAIGAQALGAFGPVVGWPLFIALSIIVGNFSGLARGEWRAAPKRARIELLVGIMTLTGAVVLIGIQ